MEPLQHDDDAATGTAAQRTRLTVLRDADEAERIADVLRAAGIDAGVEIDDVERALPGTSVLPGLLTLPGPMFAYPLTVPVADRAQALRILDERDEIDGTRRHLSPGTLGRGVAVALGLGAVAAAVRLALA